MQFLDHVLKGTLDGAGFLDAIESGARQFGDQLVKLRVEGLKPVHDLLCRHRPDGFRFKHQAADVTLIYMA
jgi:hypothetical protein